MALILLFYRTLCLLVRSLLVSSIRVSTTELSLQIQVLKRKECDIAHNFRIYRFRPAHFLNSLLAITITLDSIS
jgi:hypothetical protein